jgi:hypothetical protein
VKFEIQLCMLFINTSMPSLLTLGVITYHFSNTFCFV